MSAFVYGGLVNEPDEWMVDTYRSGGGRRASPLTFLLGIVPSRTRFFLCFVVLSCTDIRPLILTSYTPAVAGGFTTTVIPLHHT